MQTEQGNPHETRQSELDKAAWIVQYTPFHYTRTVRSSYRHSRDSRSQISSCFRHTSSQRMHLCG